MSKPKIVAIVGPTASGKTALSIEIAKKFNGEVISADSRQVYKGLDIGTGKVTKEEMGGVPHHLLDMVDPTEVYTAVDFKRDATAAILDIQNRGKLPIIAGGSFFYIELLRGNTQAAPTPPNEEFRNGLSEFSNEELLAKLKESDPVRAADVDPDNRRRLIRALEIIDSLGHIPAIVKTESPYEWLILGTKTDKDELRKNYAKRIDNWLQVGFENEVTNLLKTDISKERFQEIGFEYTLMLEYISGKLSLEELKEKFVQKNWQYAKRQMTWLKRDGKIEWFTPTNTEVIFKRIEDFIA